MSLFKHIEKNTTKKLELVVNEDYIIPVYLFSGANPGKNLVITSGVHGSEYVGLQMTKELIKELDTSKMSGNVLVVPMINTGAFYGGFKEIVPGDKDHKNLNRVFPGSKNGTLAEQIAYAIEKEVYPEADFIADFHSADLHESMTPLIFYPVASGEEVKNYTEDLTANLTTTYRVKSTASTGLYSYATRLGIPAIILERGGRGQWSDEEVQAAKKNAYEIMNYLEIVDYPKGGGAIIIEEAVYEEAPCKGMWYPKVTCNQEIKKGDLLGQLEDFEGNVLHEVTANFDGVVLYYTHALGVKGDDPLIAYGKY